MGPLEPSTLRQNKTTAPGFARSAFLITNRPKPRQSSGWALRVPTSRRIFIYCTLNHKVVIRLTWPLSRITACHCSKLRPKSMVSGKTRRPLIWVSSSVSTAYKTCRMFSTTFLTTTFCRVSTRLNIVHRVQFSKRSASRWPLQARKCTIMSSCSFRALLAEKLLLLKIKCTSYHRLPFTLPKTISIKWCNSNISGAAGSDHNSLIPINNFFDLNLIKSSIFGANHRLSII